MHEMSLAQEVLAITDEAARAAGATKVLRVRVKIGWLMQVEQQSLRFYLEILRKRHPCLEEADFDLQEVAVRLRCRSCGAETKADSWAFSCCSCGSIDVEVIAGDRLEVADMEVQIADV